MRSHSITRKLVSAGSSLVLALGMILLGPGIVADAATNPEIIFDEAPHSADALPTAQINGVAWAQKIIGNTVYVGGEFTKARPAGAAAGVNETTKGNLMAYDVRTGQMIQSWAPTANAAIQDIELAPDGSLFIAGQFTSVNGSTRYRVAKVDATNGAVLPWVPNVNGRVDSIAVKGNVVYLAGQFSAVNGVARSRVAALDASTGGVLPFSVDAPGGYGAKGVVVSPDGNKVVFIGDFLSVNGSTTPGRGMAAVDATTGTLLPWAANSVVRNANMRAGMYAVSADEESVYATGWDYGGSSQDGFEGSVRMSWDDGSIIWLEDCHGDTYDVASVSGTVYIAGHPHYCGNIGGFPQTNPWTFYQALAFTKEPAGQLITADIYGYKSYTGHRAPKPLNWYPEWTIGTYTGMDQGPFSVEGNEQYLVYGGEFLRVNRTNQQGLVRFAVRDIAPNQEGPMNKGGAYPLSATSLAAGHARVTWQANHDRDNSELTYEVLRQDLAQPLHTFKQNSTFFYLPNLSYTDLSVTPGATYNYRVRVTDPTGNATWTDWVPLTIKTTGALSTYAMSVFADNPTDYWPLNEGTGSIGYNLGGANNLTVAGTRRSTAGHQLNSSDSATSFTGASTSYASTRTAVQGPHVFTIETWFKTTSRTGGKIVGFGSSATGNSTSHDRHIYLNNNGMVTFGVYPNTVKTISSGTGYNDGNWHHVVASLGPDGQTLWLDGELIGRDPSVTSAQSYSGYWRVAGDRQSSWPNIGSSQWFNGAVQDVAIYDAVLTPQQIDAHWVASGRTSTLPTIPEDAYGASVFDLSPLAYWRLGEVGDTSIAVDSSLGKRPGTYYGSTTKGVAGALAGVSDTAVNFNGSAKLVANRPMQGPSSYALETWFKTTSATGGKIIGFGDSGTAALSNNYDRHVYLDAQGFLHFGAWTGQQVIVSGTEPVNNGQWHHVVAQQSNDGMALFVDGNLVATDPNTIAQDYSGYWRVGGDTAWEGAEHFTGTIDEVAIYATPLTAQQIRDHYDMGAFGSLNEDPVASFTSVTEDLSVTLDASSSHDPDGTIVNYSWDLGDGSTATGETVQHAYDEKGTYNVVLTVTDNRGAKVTQEKSVVIFGPNEVPTADFTFSVDFLKVAFDASNSADSDGDIVSYSWAFGDGDIGVGEQVTHTYALGGDYDVTLTVTDDRDASAVHTATVTAIDSPNQTPSAVFAASIDGLRLAVDGSGSSDPDGTVESYVWDFGDGASGSGKTASHTYAEAGTYTVKLTVTDDKGAEATTTETVVASAFDVVAADSFGRAVASGWGTADVGGSWVGGTGFFVADGAGKLSLQPGTVREIWLPAVASSNSRSSVSFSSDSSFSGGVQSITLTGRQVGSSTYTARVRIESGGLIRLYILRDETALAGSYIIPGYSYQAGDVLHLELDVLGTSPTTVSGWVWPEGTARPTAPNLTATDNTAGLQTTGRVGFKASNNAASTVTRLLSFTDFLVVDPTVVVVNQDPVAVFSASVDGLKVSVDGSGSSDPDGTVESYVWDFGDGASGSGKTASHTYAEAGTYTVKLTVTDDKGATADTTKSIVVDDAVAPNQDPVAVFSASVDGLKVSVDGSGSSDPDGTVESYVWDFGDGASGSGKTASHTYAEAGTYTVKLTVTDDKGATADTTKSVTAEAGPEIHELARDDFGRTASGAWGFAQVGGEWTLSGGANAFSVADGQGLISLSPSWDRYARLRDVSASTTETTMELSAGQESAGGASHVTILGRQVGNDYYGARVRFEANGVVRLYLLRNETALVSSYVIPNYTYQAEEVLKVKLSVSGTNSTDLNAKLWFADEAEPTAWTLSSTDSYAELQTSGIVGIKATVSSASTNQETVFRIDDWLVVGA